MGEEPAKLGGFLFQDTPTAVRASSLLSHGINREITGLFGTADKYKGPLCWHLVPVAGPGCCAPSQRNAIEFLPLGTHRSQNERAELSLSCCAALLSSLQPQSGAGTSLACPLVPFPCGSGDIAHLGFRLGLWQSSGSVSLHPGTAAATVPRRNWCWMHQTFS